MRVVVWKWYSDNRLKLVMDKEYNGKWSYLWDFVKENLPVRRVGAFFVHIIDSGNRRREFLVFFRNAEFDWGKAGYILQDDEVDAIKTILYFDGITQRISELMAEIGSLWLGGDKE